MDTTVGSIQLLATIDTSQYKQGAREIDNANKGIQDSTDSTERQSNSAFSNIAKVGIAGLIAATVAVGAAIVGNIGGAIRRVDTLNNSTRVFEQMGFQAEDADKAIATLTKSIQGLPTPLDAAVRSTTALAATYGDISLGQKVFTALNNAIIGFGGSANEVENAITQLSQLPLDGPLDAQTWNSLRNSGLTPVLVALSKDFGMSIGDLREAFGKGELTVQDFVNALIRLNTEGGGGLQSLESIAQSATSGISTGFANMQTAITRGLASIIESVGSANIANAISTIGSAFESALKNVGGFISFIIANKDIFGPIAAGITALVGAITAWAIVTKVITIAQAAFNAVLLANPIGLIITTIVGLVAGLIYFFTQTELGKDIVANVFKFIGEAIANVISVVTTVANGISTIFQEIVRRVTNVVNNVQAIFQDVVNIVRGIFTDVVDTITGIVSGIVSIFEDIWNGIVGVFNGIVDFFKKWGITILALILLPLTLAVGLIIQYWEPIKAFFMGIRDFIVGVFTPIVTFFTTIFTAAYQAVVAIWTSISSFFTTVFTAAVAGITSVWNSVVTYFTTIWNGIVAVFLVVAEFFRSVFATAWAGVVFVWDVAVIYFTTIWNNIVSVFSAVVGFFSSVFTSAWNAITSAFSSVVTFFRDNVWNPIVALFTNVGTAIGNAIGGAFKSIVNSVLRFAVNTINTFIDAINGAIDIINNVPGVNVGKIGRLPIPQLAEGGIVSKATLAVIGEGSEPEAVIPLSKLDKMISGEGGARTEYNIENINISNEVDGDRWLRRLTNDQEIVSSNLVPTQKYMGA